MNSPTKPSWYYNWNNKGIENITKDCIERWQKETDEYNQKLTLFKKEQGEKLKQLKTLAENLFEKHSKELKYINNIRLQHFEKLDFKLEVLNKINDYHNHKAKEESKEQARKNRENYVVEAAAWLIEKGLKLGTDFTSETAILTANDIAFEEKVKELTKNGGYFSFSGENCEDCEGWDGISHRCQCGNRRVCWSMCLGFSFNDPNSYIYAEAY